MENPFKDRTYKYGVETYLLMYLQDYQFILGADLARYSESNDDDAFFNKDNPCNIYFVLRRPKVTIKPESFITNGQKTCFDFVIHKKGDFIPIPISIESLKASSILELETVYPYNLFIITDGLNPIYGGRPGTIIDNTEVGNNIENELLDYEILYIGQSYGKDGSRTALDRLSVHETVQKIYTDSLTNTPDCDIWILLTNFVQESHLLNLAENSIKSNIENENVDTEKSKSFFDTGLKFTEKQKINFTEAALIRYFEPIYNKEFKSTFPNEKHTSYSECYTLDIRGITIELYMPEMVRCMYTAKTGRIKHHYHTFEFQNDKDRISLLGMNEL